MPQFPSSVNEEEQNLVEWNEVAQSRLILYDPTNCSLLGSSVLGIFQARGLPFPSPGHLPQPGIEFASLALAGRFFPAEQSGKAT